MQERRAKDYTKKGKKLEDCGACLKTDFKMVSYMRFNGLDSSDFFPTKKSAGKLADPLKNIKLTLVLGLLAMGFKSKRPKNRGFRLG